MRVLEIQGAFGLENLKTAERPRPEPGPGQVLLKMKAASLNYRDWLMILGAYNPKQPLPLIPCSDGVGEVVEVGEGVSRVQVGERVCPIFAQAWLSGEPTRDKFRSTLGGPYDGTLAEYMVLDAEGVVSVPEYLTDEEAATLPCAALTAWSSLVTLGQLKAGDTVLAQGTGGVSIFALQFAKALGAHVIITSSSNEKLERAKALGADDTLNYREDPKWGKTLSKKYGGIDHIIEVGGANTLAQSLRAVRFGGHISMIGVLSGVSSEVNLLPILMQQLKIQGVLVGHREGFEAMNRGLNVNKLRPVVDKVFGFDEVTEAFEHLSAGRHFGKVCIRFDD